MIGAFEDLVSSDPDAYFGANQFYNEDNPATHYATTGPEIWAQTGGEIDYFVHGVGTGGCISGAGKFLKEKKPGEDGRHRALQLARPRGRDAERAALDRRHRRGRE